MLVEYMVVVCVEPVCVSDRVDVVNVDALVLPLTTVLVVLVWIVEEIVRVVCVAVVIGANVT